jgi:hypothetical protein
MERAAACPFQELSDPDSTTHSAGAYTTLPGVAGAAPRKRFSITRIPIAPLIPGTYPDGGASCNNLLQKTPPGGPTVQTLGRFRIQRIPVSSPPAPGAQRPERLPGPLGDDDDLIQF